MPENVWEGMTGWPSKCMQRIVSQDEPAENQDALAQRKLLFGAVLPHMPLNFQL